MKKQSHFSERGHAKLTEYSETGENKCRDERLQRWIYLLWLMAAAVNIKSIFTDYGVDNAYALTTSYRHIIGDRMFLEMWEPHQTSTFLTDLLVMVYRVFVPSLEGVAIYLQICGVMLYAAVTYALFRGLSRTVSKIPAHFICIFFFAARAKQTVFPEFSNMQIAFSALLVLYLCRYMYVKKKYIYLVLASFFLCLEGISYPSSSIVIVPVVFWLYKVSQNRKKDACMFVLPCVLLWGGYAGYFAVRTGGIEEFVKRLLDIFGADSSHGYLEGIGCRNAFDFIYGVIWVISAALLSVILHRIWNRYAQKKVKYVSVFGVILAVSEVVLLLLMSGSGIDWKYAYTMVFPVAMLIGMGKFQYLEKSEKEICGLGYLVSLSSFCAVCLLTNLGILTVFSYLIIGTAFSFIPIWKWYLQRKSVCGREKAETPIFLICLCLLTIFHRGLTIMGYSSERGSGLIFDMENIIRCGPSMGIVAPIDICNRASADWREWPQYMGEGDSCLAVGDWLIDSSVYLNSKAQVGNYSVINTTTYDETLLKYWEMYPEKSPTVIAVAGYEGVPEMRGTWIAEWVEENYDRIDVGTFWIFYRSRN